MFAMLSTTKGNLIYWNKIVQYCNFYSSHVYPDIGTNTTLDVGITTTISINTTLDININTCCC